MQNPRPKLYDKCLCLSYVFGSVLDCMCKVCSGVSEALLIALLLITLTQTVRLFYVSLRSQAPQQQYTVHCMHYGITLWAYLTEPLVKDSHKRLSSTEKPQYCACSSRLITHYHYVRATEIYTETLHVKKMVDVQHSHGKFITLLTFELSSFRENGLLVLLHFPCCSH